MKQHFRRLYSLVQRNVQNYQLDFFLLKMDESVPNGIHLVIHLVYTEMYKMKQHFRRLYNLVFKNVKND